MCLCVSSLLHLGVNKELSILLWVANDILSALGTLKQDQFPKTQGFSFLLYLQKYSLVGLQHKRLTAWKMQTYRKTQLSKQLSQTENSSIICILHENTRSPRVLFRFWKRRIFFFVLQHVWGFDVAMVSWLAALLSCSAVSRISESQQKTKADF